VSIIRALFVIFLLGATIHPAYSEQSGLGQPVDDGPMPLEKGTVEVAVIGGTTLPISLFRAKPDRRLTLGSFGVGWVMTNQVGNGPLAGHFELLLEIAPLVLINQPTDSAFGLTVSPLFLRWNFAPVGPRRARLFAEASGGILYTSNPVPVRTTSFNFIDQAGFGVRFEQTSRRAWLIGYRFQHISNGGRVKPNPGSNFNFVYAGVSFLR
jgi:hypothetical protein